MIRTLVPPVAGALVAIFGGLPALGWFLAGGVLFGCLVLWDEAHR